MKTRTKVLVLMLAAVLLVTATVFTTLAFLQSSDQVTNTFTVGKVGITLDEAKVDEMGDAVADAARVKANTYKLIPGHSYTKDPTVHVASDSEDCYVYVKIDNGISAIEGANKIADQMKTGWTCIDTANNIWAYNDVCEKGDDVVVFSSFEISETADVASYSGKTITVVAYAVQADGFDSASAAWAAAGDSFID